MLALIPVVALMVVLAPALKAQAQSGECPFEPSQAVELSTAQSVFNVLNDVAPVKDEFETTKQFELRRQAALQEPAIDKVYLVEGTLDREHFTYDADKGVFSGNAYTLSNIHLPLAEVFTKDNPFDVAPISIFELFQVESIGLSSDEKVVGTRPAQNAMGATVDVFEVDRQIFGVFDDKQDGDALLWAFQNSTRTVDEDKFQIEVPRGEAREFKDNAKVAFAIKPKLPLAASATDYFEATFQNPRALEATYNVIVADILCAAVLDKDNEVVGVFDRK